MEESTQNPQTHASWKDTFSKIMIKLGFAKPVGRKPFHVGWMAPGKSLDQVRLYLHSEWGFGRNEAHIHDQDIVLNWCRLTSDHKKYSIQIYNDGEIRGSYENIPMTGILEKLSDMGEKEAKEEFLKFLGECSVEKKFISHHTSESKQIEPEPEMLSVNAPE
ncbi:MAG: hypothetical protein ACKOW9_03005 [Candidatus Paceibacterota bacterium]